MRVPLGVIGIIYESRPNVTVDAAALCIKSGNAAILRGGSEAIALQPRAGAPACADALAAAGLPRDAVQLVETTDRDAVGRLVAMPEFVDVIVPRGGKGLIERLMRESARAGDQAPRRHLPRLRRRRRRPRHGGAHRRQRQDPALRHLQHDGDAAGRASASPPSVLPRLGRIYAAKGVEMRGDASRLRDCCSRRASPASPRARRTGAPSTWRRSSRSASSTASTRRSRTSTSYGSQHTDAIVTDDHARARCASCARSTRPR